MVNEPEPELFITKHVAHILVSEEMLMDCGVIPDTRPPPPPPPPVPWRRRLRWRLADARERAAARAYRLISGRSLPEDDDD